MLRRWLRRLRSARAPATDLPDSLASAVGTLARRLGELNIAHALIGGVAVSMHGLRVDFLFAQGRHTRDMLGRARVVQLRQGQTRLVAPEDLIALKLQALANRPDRVRDRVDIEALLRRFSTSLDMELVREYHVLFVKEAELDALLATLRGGSP